MIKNYFTTLLLLASFPVFSQHTYNYSNYAANGDTVYLTKAELTSQNFDTTGVSMNWDYSSLQPFSQRRLLFRDPKQTGFSIVQWSYVYNTSNVNLSATDGEAYEIGNLQATDFNAYYLKNSSELSQKATSYKIVVTGKSLNIKTTYDSPDKLYQFPLNYGNKDSSESSYTSSIPSLYYRETSIKRVNEVVGYGSVITPYGTFSNCIKMVSDVRQIDTIAIDTISFPTDTFYTRELKWLDASKKYPLLIVKQTKVGNYYVTQSVEYLDNKQILQPEALFVYLPLYPVKGDTVFFQNISINGTTYNWDFGDPSSGDNSSTDKNPEHVFNSVGTFIVKMTAYNESLMDTISVPVVVGYDSLPDADFDFSPNPGLTGSPVQFNNLSQRGKTYVWSFGDSGSGSNYSGDEHPIHTYNATGNYAVQLIVTNNLGSDTLVLSVQVDSNYSTALKKIESYENKVYPNPTSGIVYMNIKERNSNLILFDITGKEKMRLGSLPKTSALAIDVSGLAAGIYFLQVNGPSVQYTERIVLQ